MSHRIKNLFALADSMLHQSARNAGSKEELTEALSGRLHALAKAHSFVLRDAAPGTEGLALGDLARWILEPHTRGDDRRVEIGGKHLLCEEQTASSIALVLNELATNSVKYGALSVDGGKVAVAWDINGAAVCLS